MILSNFTSILPNVTNIPVISSTTKPSEDDDARWYTWRTIGLIIALFAGVVVLNCLFLFIRMVYNAGFYLGAIKMFLLPKKIFRSAPHNRGQTCALCAEECNHGDSLRILPCRHAFHLKCICKFAIDYARDRRSNRCPICLEFIHINNITRTCNPFGLLPNGECPLIDSESAEWPSYGAALID